MEEEIDGDMGDEDDEMADFIDDEEFDEHGKPVRYVILMDYLLMWLFGSVPHFC